MVPKNHMKMAYSHFGDYIDRGSMCKSSVLAQKWAPDQWQQLFIFPYVEANNPPLHSSRKSMLSRRCIWCPHFSLIICHDKSIISMYLSKPLSSLFTCSPHLADYVMKFKKPGEALNKIKN